MAHQCTLQCGAVPCVGTNIASAEHAFQVLCHSDFMVTNVRPCLNPKKPFCTYIVDYKKINENQTYVDERAKPYFTKILTKTPTNVVPIKRSINFNPPVYTVEYKVKCTCTRPNFELLQTRSAIELTADIIKLEICES